MDREAITPIQMPSQAQKAIPRLDSEHRELAREAARYLDKAFGWAETAEGFDFWSSVEQRLFGLADGEPLR